MRSKNIRRDASQMMRLTAPRKSIRTILDKRWSLCSCWDGSWRRVATRSIAIAHSGTWARKALCDSSDCQQNSAIHFLSAPPWDQVTYHRQPMASVRNPPGKTSQKSLAIGEFRRGRQTQRCAQTSPAGENHVHVALPHASLFYSEDVTQED